MVKRYDPYKGWGFVECSDLPSDALLSRRDVDKCIDDIKNGDQVSFAIDFTETGKPRARELEIFVEAGDRFVGAIKLINATKKFGFVTCHDLREAVGQDIFVGERPLVGFAVGDLVSFAVQFNWMVVHKLMSSQRKGLWTVPMVCASFGFSPKRSARGHCAMEM